MKLHIGGPTRDTVPASVLVDAAQLYAYTREHGPWGSAVTIGFLATPYVHVGREAVLERVIAEGATHLLWLDTDMRFPPETAVRLARHDRPFVACNCVTRDGSRRFTALKDRQPVATRPESMGLDVVDSVGLAVVLMRTELARLIPKPWFSHGRTEHGTDIGEDRMFCRYLRDAGQVLYIDHDLSKEIGHVGQRTYYTVDPETETAAVR